MALETSCQTDGCIFGIIVSPKEITVNVELPFALFLNGEEHSTLHANLHNAVELVLSKYFYKNDDDENKTQ